MENNTTPEAEINSAFAIAAWQDADCHKMCPSSTVIRLAKAYLEQEKKLQIAVEALENIKITGHKEAGDYPDIYWYLRRAEKALSKITSPKSND
jgi:hypothetical protein